MSQAFDGSVEEPRNMVPTSRQKLEILVSTTILSSASHLDAAVSACDHREVTQDVQLAFGRNPLHSLLLLEVITLELAVDFIQSIGREMVRAATQI